MTYVRKTIDEHVCPVCGKIFYIPDSKTWVYRAMIKNRHKPVCSWGCMRKVKTGKEKKNDLCAI